MKTVIIYPLPFDAWNTFEPFVIRFTSTLKQFDPGCDFRVMAMCCQGRPTPKVRRLFDGIKTDFIPYYDDGADIGSAQHASRMLLDNVFMLMMTSRCYFHREGWLERMVSARKEHGAGLYGCSANHDSHRLHLCTRAYAMDAGDFKLYPYVVRSRYDGPMFEVGYGNRYGNIMEWMESRQRKARLVFFDGVREKSDWFTAPNRFRCGDQSNMLVWDKHTDLFAQADYATKTQLQINNLPPSA